MGSFFLPIKTCKDSKPPFSRYNLVNFYVGVRAGGLNIKGPIWRPVRLIMNLIVFAFAVLVPLLYGIIFRFLVFHSKFNL